MSKKIEDTFDLETARREFRFYFDLFYGLTSALRDLPEDIDPFVAKHLSCCAAYPVDYENGKEIQRERGLDVVPPKYECEGGAGYWWRLRNALLSAPPQRKLPNAEDVARKVSYLIRQFVADNVEPADYGTKFSGEALKPTVNAILSLLQSSASSGAQESDGKAGSPVQSLGDNPDPAPSRLEQGLATPDTTGTASEMAQGEVAHVGNVAKPEIGPDRIPRVDHQPCPSDPSHGEQPVAWIAFAGNGNVRFWTADEQRAQREKERGLDLRSFTLAELVSLSARATPQQSGWRSDMENAPRGEPFLAFERQARGPFMCWWHEDATTGEAYWMDEADSEPCPSYWKLLDLPTPPSEQKR